MNTNIVISIPMGGEPTAAAYCLKTDSWHDYLAFKEDAKRAEAERDYRNAHRFLRAALICLFSHLEGVVKDITESRTIPAIHAGTRLCDKTRNIGAEAKKYARVPHLNFRLGKHLRDLIAHPGIEIVYSDAPTGSLIAAAVFEELNLLTLEELETQIGAWLDAVCSALGVSRFTNTEHLVTELASALGNITEMLEV